MGWLKAIVLCVGLIVGQLNRAAAQDFITLIIQQGITRVIKAVDLKIQRLQTKTIWLQNAQKVMENAMSKLKLGEISDLVEKQRVLYRDYFQELWKVKDVLAYYHRVKEILELQVQLVKEYKKAWKGVESDRHFSAVEISYIGSVYAGIIEQSIKNLDQVGLVINSFTTQMTDAKRMEIITRAAEAIEENFRDLKAFSSQNIRVSLQRAKDEKDIAVVKQLYGME